MKKAIGIVTGALTHSILDSDKPSIEIELEEKDKQLLLWINKKVLIKEMKE